MQIAYNRFQKWNLLFFEKATLKSVGLRVQLGHPATERCSLPQRAFNDDFVVIDSGGVHEIGLDFCGCEKSIPKTIQLLRHRLFPATVVDPKSAATFGVLESFQLLTFTSKVSGYEFYRALARRTDNTGVDPPPVREYYIEGTEPKTH